MRSTCIVASLGALAIAIAGVRSMSPAGAQETSPQPDQSKSSERRSGSPQGITGDADDRRDRAKRRREADGERRRVGTREIRTYDGSGNNVANPEWGATFAHLQRFGPADYADGISALAGPLRPSARVISNEIVSQDEDESIVNPFGTSDFMWQWGQFLDHDLDLTDGGADEIADIEVPPGDPFFDPDGSGAKVIPFSRAIFDPATGTDLSNPRQQENEITSWIDASMVYGSDVERAAALRVGPDSPFLKTSAGDLLPFNTDGLANANGPVADATTLFLAGDVRANEQLGLTVMHTLFVREHNRLAALLQRKRRNASPEEIFQTARRLVVAEIQIISYNEFLPALLGPDAIDAYRRYDASLDATIFNEFSVAAYRLGHSMLSNEILRLDPNGAPIADGSVALRDAFFTGALHLQNGDDLDPILRGLAAQPHQKIDVKIVNALRNFLFGPPGAGGLDLASLNIQRGRDHGVGSYNDTREALGLARVSDFDEITSDAGLQQALFETYGSVDDIDLWIGGLAEDAVAEGSQLGPLFREILIRQFSALRDGDRFWFERDLTRDELEMLDGVTLARVIRDNTGIGEELSDNVFYVGEPNRRPRNRNRNRN